MRACGQCWTVIQETDKVCPWCGISLCHGAALSPAGGGYRPRPPVTRVAILFLILYVPILIALGLIALGLPG